MGNTAFGATWSATGAGMDSEEQARLRALHMKQWRSAGPLQYTMHAAPLQPPETEVRAWPPFRTPLYGGGDSDRESLRRPEKGRVAPVPEDFQADLDLLARLKESKETYKRVPETLYLGTVVVYLEGVHVRLGKVTHALPGKDRAGRHKRRL